MSDNRNSNPMMKKILSTLMISLLGSLAYPQSTFKERINNYEDICFCDVELSHPMLIIEMDNNMELLFAIEKGRTLNELRQSGVKYSQSQINLMEVSGLIGKKDSIYYSKIPILSENETNMLRTDSKRMAESISPLLTGDLDSLLKTINSKGLQKSSYTLFFSFILDGLVWEILKQTNEIEETRIIKENPFWNGTFWMMEPKREFSCGTNSLSSGNYSINVMWSEKSDLSASNYKEIKELLNDLAKNGKITKPEVFTFFSENRFFNKEGELQFPIITSDSTDNFYKQSKNFAQKLAQFLKNDIDYSTILVGCPDLTKDQKIIIFYHEMMWDILNIFENTGQIIQPLAFRKPEEAKDADLKDLIFIVKN